MHLFQECSHALIFMQDHPSLEMLFDGVWNAVPESNVTLSSVTTPCLDASWEKPACHGSGSPHILVPRAAKVCWRQRPCPKPGQTDSWIEFPTPKVCVNLVYPMCGSQAKGNAARLWSRAVCGGSLQGGGGSLEVLFNIFYCLWSIL